MDDLAADIAAHGHDPQIEAENAAERLYVRSQDIIDDHEQMKEDIRFSRLPLWMKEYEMGLTIPGVDNLDYPEEDK